MLVNTPRTENKKIESKRPFKFCPKLKIKYIAATIIKSENKVAKSKKLTLILFILIKIKYLILTQKINYYPNYAHHPGNNPQAHSDLRFGPAEGFEVMVQRSRFKKFLFEKLPPENLEQKRNRLGDKYKPGKNQQEWGVD